MSFQNKPGTLGTERIGKLLMHYSVPAITGTAAASLYNIIDRIFIGQGVGPMAISGLALTFPMMNITAAFGSLVGSGAAAMVSIRLGQQNRKEATLILGNTLKLNIVISLLVTALALIFIDPILYALGASADTLPYAKEYMQIILAGNVFTHLYIGLNSVMRSSGYPKKAMVTTLITVTVNIVLTPLFIFGFKWGIRGAAIATVISQTVGTVWVIIHFMQGVSFLHFLPGYFKLTRKIISDIFSIGMANFIMLTIASLVFILINHSLKNQGGDFAIGAFGIIFSIVSLVLMVVLGLNLGMQPIAGYNFGAGNYNRVIRVFKLTLIAASTVSVVGFLMSELFPRTISRAFTSHEGLLDLSATGMRLYMMMTPIVGFQMVTTSFFQSIGKAKISILLSLSRQAIFLIPALLIMPRLIGLNGVWLSAPVSDFLSSLLTAIILYVQLKRIPEFSNR